MPRTSPPSEEAACPEVMKPAVKTRRRLQLPQYRSNPRRLLRGRLQTDYELCMGRQETQKHLERREGRALAVCRLATRLRGPRRRGGPGRTHTERGSSTAPGARPARRGQLAATGPGAARGEGQSSPHMVGATRLAYFKNLDAYLTSSTSLGWASSSMTGVLIKWTGSEADRHTHTHTRRMAVGLSRVSGMVSTGEGTPQTARKPPRGAGGAPQPSEGTEDAEP